MPTQSSPQSGHVRSYPSLARERPEVAQEDQRDIVAFLSLAMIVVRRPVREPHILSGIANSFIDGPSCGVIREKQACVSYAVG
jgi:hypothetical protein